MPTTKFAEPGGDATFNVALTSAGGFWDVITGAPVVATDFINTGHVKSIKYPVNATSVLRKSGVVQDAGARLSAYFYFNVKPSANSRFFSVKTSAGAVVFALKMTSAGVLFLVDVNGTQIGSNGATLSTGQFYRISIAYTLTSTTVNSITVFVNGVSSISNNNYTFPSIGTADFSIGNEQANVNLDFRSSDHYVDDSSALTDTGNIFVTAKRPNANGTTNGFSTQIGAGGSGYGTGHSPQVNERALSTTNGWSMVGAGSAVTEEYNIENKATGDTDITNSTIVDYVGWVDVKSLVGETISIILGGGTSSQAITSSITMYTKAKGSTTYPAGSGADIGIITDTSLTTVSLYECGILVIYIPNTLKTITGVSRIQQAVLKTITGLSRIQQAVLETIIGLARITAKTLKTIPGVSRITAKALQTITGVSRITNVSIRTETGLSRIQVSTLKTIQGVANISNSTPSTQGAKAYIYD